MMARKCTFFTKAGRIPKGEEESVIYWSITEERAAFNRAEAEGVKAPVGCKGGGEEGRWAF